MKKLLLIISVLFSLGVSAQKTDTLKVNNLKKWNKDWIKIHDTLFLQVPFKYATGAGNNKVWTSNAQGVGSWKTATGLLSSGSAAGNTPYWDGAAWVVNSSNIYNAGANVGIGTTSPASKLQVGDQTTGANMSVMATRGSELSPDLTTGWTGIGAVWQYVATPSRIEKFADGTTVLTPTSQTISIGTSYEVTITVDAASGGQIYISLGGQYFRFGTTVVMTAGTYTDVLTATTTAKLSIAPQTSTARCMISAISVKALTDNTGDATIGGNLTVKSPATFLAPVTFRNITSSVTRAYAQTLGANIGDETYGFDIGYINVITPNSSLTLNSTSGGAINMVSNGAGNIKIYSTTTGKVAIGNITPTSWLHVKAGTTDVAPFQLTSGTLKASPLAGAMEFLIDDYYATITTGTARKGIVLNDGTALTSGRIPFATTNGRLTDASGFTFGVTLANTLISPYITVLRDAGAGSEQAGLTLQSTGTSTTMGTSIALDATVGTGVNGKRFDIISTGAGAEPGDGFFAILNRSDSKYEFVIKGNGNTGINTYAPDKQLEINSSTGACLRLTYNDNNGGASNYVDFSVSSSGDLTITPSGGDVNLGSANLATTGALKGVHKAADGTSAVADGTYNFNTSGSGQVSSITIKDGVITTITVTP